MDDQSESDSNTLFGTTSEPESLWSLTLDQDGRAKGSTLSMSALAPRAKIAAVVPGAHGRTVHLLASADAGYAYIVYDLAAGKMTKSVPLATPQMPLFGLLGGNESQI